MRWEAVMTSDLRILVTPEGGTDLLQIRLAPSGGTFVL